MSILNAAKILHLCYLSKPTSDRAIYRLIHQGKVRKIVELGIATGDRALRMIEVAAAKTARNDILYTGMDLFEARTDADGRGRTLKAAHQMLRPTGAKIQLLPGAPFATLTRAANALGKIDLLILSAGVDLSDTKAWWYVPRLLHDETRVCMEEPSSDGQQTLRWISREEIARLASATNHRHAA